MRTRVASGGVAFAAVVAVAIFAPAAASGPVRFSGASGLRCRVPKAVGLSLARAEKAIRVAGCRVGALRRRTSTLLGEDRVLGQSLPWGRMEHAGAHIRLVVGDGPRTGRLPRLGAVVPSRLPRYIAYDPPGGGIWLVKPDGTDSHQVGPLDGSDPVWSPDANKILYQAPALPNDHGVTEDAYVMNADGTDQHPIMPSAGGAGDWLTNWRDFDFHWSADGKQIVFTQQFSLSSAVEVANADGSDPHLVPLDANGVAASFSPDGRNLVFVDSYAERNPFPATWGIYVVKPDGKRLRRIIVGGGVGDPSWSPDGHNIIYSCLHDNSGFHGICELSGKPRRQRMLYANRYQTLLHPSWNANGREILVTAERGENRPGQIALMSPSGRQLVKTGIFLAAGTYPDW